MILSDVPIALAWRRYTWTSVVNVLLKNQYVGVQVDTHLKTRTLKGMYFQMVESQVLFNPGDVNLMCSTCTAFTSRG